MSSMLLLQDGEPKARFALLDKTAVGRSSSCEIQVLSPELSRRHAVIERRADGWFIEDAGRRTLDWFDKQLGRRE